MDVIARMLKDVPLPPLRPVRQKFDDTRLEDVAAGVREQIARPEIAGLVKAGQSIAIGVGSRGLDQLPVLVKATVAALKDLGAEPFIVPAMGSHGGASDEGQAQLLAKLGVDEARMGCPVRSSMETVELGRLPNGLPVLMDREAMQADGIVVINRVKPHTSFSGRIESGLAKMLTIGLGKHKGAESCHAQGFGVMEANVTDMARMKIETAPILFGLASVENAYDKIRFVEAVPADQILTREPELLQMAKANMPRILLNPLDVLVVDEIGKEYSGTGADPNITGRPSTPYLKPTLNVGKMAYLRLSPTSGGNATGIGLCDVTTRAMFEAMDFAATYANAMTSTVLAGARVPPMMETERLAVQAAIKTCNAADPERLRIVRIPNTLHLGTILVSDALVAEAEAEARMELDGAPQDWDFDAQGRLAPFHAAPRAA